MNNPQINQHIFVNAFARLHMGFLDLNGSQGRQFGSVGVGLDAPDTLVELAIGEDVFGEVEANYVKQNKQLILQYANIKQAVSIKVHREIPRHFGLGSGTQMALAVGTGINRLFDLDLSLDVIASLTNRGQRSGVGIGTFVSGGLVLDGGKSPSTVVPPIIAQQRFPEQWRILLIFDHHNIGVHGDEEKQAFANLKEADLHATQAINYQVLMRALPAIQEQNLQLFGEAIAALQAYTGDYFAPVQGGRYASQIITQVLNYLNVNGITCVGQSSWGPTGFAVFENEVEATRYLTQLKTHFKQPALSWLLCKAHNGGAMINTEIKPKFNS